MKKIVKTLMATALIVTIVATPLYTVNSPSFSNSVTINSNKNCHSGTTIK